MKMISRQRSSTKRKLLAIVVCAVLALVLLSTPLVTTLGSSVLMLHRPINNTFLLVPNAWRNISDRWQGVEALRHERDVLQQERDSKSAELTAIQASIADYDALRSLRDAHRDDRILAGVLITPNISPYDSLVVDKGTSDDVRDGAIVYADKNTPIGVVTRTLNTTAIVELFSSPGMATQVFVRGPNVHAKAIGAGGGTLNVLLPHGVELKEGDSVIMPTLSGEHIGTIAHTTSDPAEPGTTASVVGNTALSSLRFVSIAKNVFEMPSRTDIEKNIHISTTTTAAIFILPPGIISSTSSTVQ